MNSLLGNHVAQKNTGQMATERRFVERRKTNRGPRGRTGKTGPKGDRGAWPSDAFDLLQAQIDALRESLDQMRHGMDGLHETLDHLDERVLRNRKRA